MDTNNLSWLSRFIGAEFADIKDWPQLVRLVLRVGLAMLLGCILGYERERQGKAAGLRTHMLVAMGSALFVLTAQQADIATTDMSRVIQGLVAGLGFLCAGTIMKQGEATIKGLTSAAGLWLTAAIGMACGLGQQLTAIFTTVMVMAVLTLIPPSWRHDGDQEREEEDMRPGRTRPPGEGE
ncbi:MgtC/SapB family protein [Corticibacter populi]|uniref:Protein MgtC n=1 Tax=Corticibacter populi TaxID=1550736 RepID=A0A3M6QWN7_9BURK|nr:MgtC/SapB family protein [Corticibacter populi]RMX06912.1 MgtC/SapB family protein [Corticibacter populi]